MRAQRHGRIINVGSAAAWVGEPGEAFYAASKRALAGYTEALRHEVWPFGIHVSIVEPGAFKTNILAAEQQTPENTIADYDAVRRAAVHTLHQVCGGAAMLRQSPVSSSDWRRLEHHACATAWVRRHGGSRSRGCWCLNAGSMSWSDGASVSRRTQPLENDDERASNRQSPTL